MKYLIILNIFIGLWGQFNKISTTNELKLEAEKAFLEKDYPKAASIYEQLINRYEQEDENIRLNLANALFLSGERKKAATEYLSLTNSQTPQTRSTAFQQLGVISALRGKYETALSDFKQALKINPENEKARYNYELVRKIYEQEQSLPESLKSGDPSGNEKDKGESRNNKQGNREGIKKQADPSGKKSDQVNDRSEEGNIRNRHERGEHERRDQEKDPLSNEEEKELDTDEKGNKEKEALKARRLNEIHISEEKAKMILEILKNEEVQYIQERKRTETNKDYKNKPDW